MYSFRFRRLVPALLTTCLVGELIAGDIEYSACTITGWTDRAIPRYRPGEPMKFYFKLLKSGVPVTGKVQITLAADDGRREKSEYEISATEPLEITASLRTPGFVMVRATLLTPQGKAAQRRWRNQYLRDIQYGLGGCVAPEQLQPALPEPEDFDEFWKKTCRELNETPMKAARKIHSRDASFTIYELVITAPGPRPATGFLTIPHDAEPKSLPLDIQFDGYAVHAVRPRRRPGAIALMVNAHGIRNDGDAAYYNALARGELRRYGFRNEENEPPGNCYFKYMLLRDLRMVEYGRTLPEWDGRRIQISGGSQGAFQAVAVTALARDATNCRISVPWFCDLGGITKGRIRGWRPDWRPGLGYYDTVHFAARVKCPVLITAGLSDWSCPPSGVQVLYNQLKGRKELTFLQGLEHGAYFGYNQASAARMVMKAPSGMPEDRR